MTQDGIAVALLLSRAHVALELKRLKSTGKVQERMAHVANARSRRKVYELTPAGQEISRRMREHARARTIELSAPEGRRTVLGAEAIEALRHAGLREAEAVQRILASDVVELPRPEPTKPAAVPSRTFFGREDERRILGGWLASDSRAVAVVIGVAGIGKSALLARALADERRPKLLRRVYAHDDAHGLLSSFADFLGHQNRRRLKAAITRPASDPTEVIAVLREDLAGCVLAIDDLHASPAADALLRAVVEHPPDAKILVATRTQPTFFEAPDVARGRVLELRLEGLDDESAAELLASRGASLEPDDVPRVVAATGGHPLALELFAASGLDAGAVETGRYVLDTVLEDLDDASENLLRTFAVLRRPARSPEAFGATLSQLRRLVRRALLHHRDEGYLLHDLVKEFFLRRMGDLRRREAHVRAASYWAGRQDHLEEAYHRIESGDLEAAVARLIDVGPAFAESARAGDLEAALLRVPQDSRLARAGPHADRSRRRPDRTRGPRQREDAALGSRCVGAERDTGRRRDSDQPRDRLEPPRGRTDGGGDVRAVRGDCPRRGGRALRLVRPGERGRQLPSTGSGRGRGRERGARGPARGDDRRSRRPVDGEGEPRPRVREARGLAEGGGPPP